MRHMHGLPRDDLELMDILHSPRMRTSLWAAPALVGFFAWVAVVLALDPAGDYPRSWPGPGLTIDERFNVVEGVLAADKLLDLDLAGYRKAIDHLPDHPPLARLIIGEFHEAAWLISPPRGPSSPISIAC